MEEYAIRVCDVSKLYKLYNKPSDRLKESLGFKKRVQYKEHYALNGVSFDVKKGETVGIIGTNGSGKSTILKIITGVLNPTKGNVEIDGRISALLELGAGFNMEYTGIENVYLNGTMIGFTKEEIDAKLQDILDFADIGEFVHQPVKTYSSGMFVRLAFAVAINIDPEILIVDEALSVGDVFFQTKCYQKFDEFKKMGKTILFVSHDLSSISKYCDRVVLLNKGDKLREGEPKEIIDSYKRLLVGAKLEANAEYGVGKTVTSSISDNVDKDSWKSAFQINPNVSEYGSRRAEIIDFGIFDDKGVPGDSIIKGSSFTIKSKVHFNEDIEKPIFTYTFKTLKGVDVTGTNTMYEHIDIPLAKAGEEYIASFTQEMNLTGGEYMLSMSCTGFENGEFTAFHRLYDVLNVTVVSDKDNVGFFDMNSKASVEKVD